MQKDCPDGAEMKTGSRI